MRRQLQLDLHQQEITETASSLDLDLVLLAGSWDPRALTGPEVLGRASEVILLEYLNPGTSGRSSEHRAELLAVAHGWDARVTEMPFSSEHVVQSFVSIWEAVQAHAKRLGRPLRIGIDLSVVPRYVSLAILAKGTLNDLVSDAYFSYQTAIYPRRDRAVAAAVSIAPRSAHYELADPDPTDGLPDSPAIFTEGRWRTVHVPGIRGSYRPGAKQHYVVALGFEGDDTYRVIQQQEPDRVTAIIPNPPVYKGLVKRCRDENEVLLRDWAGPNGQRECGALDAVSMDEVLRSLHDTHENLCLLPVGTKPHALGMAVHALRDGRPLLLYRWPERHRESGAKAGATRFRYHVHDRAAL
jgi:hypothetical protein